MIFWIVMIVIGPSVAVAFADLIGVYPTHGTIFTVLHEVANTINTILTIYIQYLLFSNYFRCLSNCRKIVESQLTYGFIINHDDYLYLKDPTGKILPNKIDQLRLSKSIILTPKFVFHNMMSHATTIILVAIGYIGLLALGLIWPTNDQDSFVAAAVIPTLMFLPIITAAIITMSRLSRTKERLKRFVKEGLCPNCSYNVMEGKTDGSAIKPPNSICSECGSHLPFIMENSFVEQTQ